MHIIKNFAGLIFGAIAIIGIFIYFKIQETNYDFIMAQAEKQQRDHPEFVDFYGEMEPGFPDKIINSRTILGIDANNNGVRDDVDIWINRTASDKNETKAMRQYAKARQDWLNTCEKQSIKDISLVQIKLEKAKICLASVSDYQRLISNFAKDKLELLLLNSEARKACSEFYLKVGTSKIQPNGDVASFYCDFEIQYYDNVIFGNAEWKNQLQNHDTILLMGVCYTQRPDLFKAIDCMVPLLDMHRYHKLLAGASWVAEYGDPDEDNDGAYIKSISPYQNIKEKEDYPIMFLNSSTKDDRVHPGHARKFAAKLFEYNHPVCYFENTLGGHAGAANFKESAFIHALDMCFFWNHLK